MKACREARRLLSKYRRKYGGKNGVIRGALLDDIWLDRLLLAKKRNLRRRRGYEELVRRIEV